MWWIVAAITLCLPLHSAQITVCRATDESSDFLLQVAPYSTTIQRRQTSVFGYLDSTGAIQPLCQAGSVWNLQNGELSSDGAVVSTPSDVTSRRFSTSSPIGNIDSIFAVTESLLFWDNAAFDNGTARFVAASDAVLSAVFGGSLPSGVQVSLKIVPLTSCAGRTQASPLSQLSSPPVSSPIGFASATSGLPSTTNLDVLTSSSIDGSFLSSTTDDHAPKLSGNSSILESSKSTTPISTATIASSVVVSPAVGAANNSASLQFPQSNALMSPSSASSATSLTTPSLGGLSDGSRMLDVATSDTFVGGPPSGSISFASVAPDKSGTTAVTVGPSLLPISQSTNSASQSLVPSDTEVGGSSATKVPPSFSNPSQVDSRILLSSKSMATGSTTASDAFPTIAGSVDSSVSPSLLTPSSRSSISPFPDSASLSTTGLPLLSTAPPPESRLLDSSSTSDTDTSSSNSFVTSSSNIGTIPPSTINAPLVVSSSTQSSFTSISPDTLASTSVPTLQIISNPQSRLLTGSNSLDNSLTTSSSTASVMTVSTPNNGLASVVSSTTTSTQLTGDASSSSVFASSSSTSLALPTAESRALASSSPPAIQATSSTSTFSVSSVSSPGTSPSIANGSSISPQSSSDTLLSSATLLLLTSSSPPPLSTVSQPNRAISPSQMLNSSSVTSVSPNSIDSLTIPASSLNSIPPLDLSSTAPRLEATSNASSTIAPASVSSLNLSSAFSQVTSANTGVLATSNLNVSTIPTTTSLIPSPTSLPSLTLSPPDGRVFTPSVSGQDLTISPTISNATITETSIVTSTPSDTTVFVYMESTMVITHTTASDTLTSQIYPTTTQNITLTIYKTITEVSTQTATTVVYSRLIERRGLPKPTQNGVVAFDPPKKLAPRGLSSASSEVQPSQAATNVTVTVVYTSTTIVPQRTVTITVTQETSQDTTLLSGDVILVATNPPTTVNATQTIDVLTTFTSTTTTTITQVVSTVSTAQATAIVGDIHGSPDDYDDFAYKVTLPFDVQIYDHAETDVYVTTNGIISLDNGTYYYDNTALPVPLPVPNYSAFPYWDDTAIYKTQPQGIYYKVTGFGNGTIVTFDFYLSHYNDDDFDFHYTAKYDTSNPGVWVYRYYRVADNGASATIGIQNYNANEFLQYSFNESTVYPGLELTFNTLQNTMETSSFDVPENSTTTVP